MNLSGLFSEITITPDQVKIPQNDLSTTGSLHTILQIVFAVAGAISLIVLIVAALQFVLSSGDPQRASKARNAIIYALIGLAICVLSFSIVTFLLNHI